MKIERRVDFLGIPVKKAPVDPGFQEELSTSPFVPRLDDSKTYVSVSVLSNEKVLLSKGVYRDRAHYAGDFRQRTIGKSINK